MDILKALLDMENKLGICLISDEEISYIQHVWNNEFDSRQSAFDIARKAGREIYFMPGFSLPEDDQKIMDQLIQDFELPPSLIDKLLSLVTEKHPSLEVWGAKKALERDVAETIQNAAKMRLDTEI